MKKIAINNSSESEHNVYHFRENNDILYKCENSASYQSNLDIGLKIWIILIKEVLFYPYILQHEFKKIRNSILNSRADGSGTRLLQLNSQYILWDFWIAAQQWDTEYNAGCRIHRNLSEASVQLDPASKMRNGYAIAALDDNMLDLMKVSKKTHEYWFCTCRSLKSFFL